MFQSVGKTDIGLKRNVNQDCFKFGKTLCSSWAIVCDGLGGEKAGDVASKIATQEIYGFIEDNYKTEMSCEEIKNLLVKAFNVANAKIFDISQENKEYTGMATTAIVSFVVDGQLHIAHVGDSRIYLIRDKKVRQLTKDDSLVQVLIEKGTLSEVDAKNHPQKNYLIKALGVEKDIDIYCDFFDISKDDVILMCSDGLHNYLDEQIILKNLDMQLSDVEKLDVQGLSTESLICEKFCHVADSFVKLALDSGGNDNITVVIMFDDYYGHESGV